MLNLQSKTTTLPDREDVHFECKPAPAPAPAPQQVIAENPVPQPPLTLKHTLADIDHPHVKTNYIYSIDPTSTDSNRPTFTVSGEYTVARFDVDSNACTDQSTDESKYGYIFVMKRMRLLDAVFTGDTNQVRILVDNRHVHTLEHPFMSL